jgi:LPXTG-motif cell wall-anchored protein
MHRTGQTVTWTIAIGVVAIGIMVVLLWFR